MGNCRVAVIGGGPGGLFAASLLARDHPGWQLTVYERLPPSDTFGFGVGLTKGLLGAVRAEEPELTERLLDASVGFSSAVFRLPEGSAELPHSHAGAISRTRLLQVLVEHAEAAGVEVSIGSSPSADELRGDADLVIAADGVSSSTREALAAELGASEQLARGPLIWCGAPIQLEGTVFMPVRTEAGTFVAHAYPYAEGLSTLVIETDEGSLRRAGCRSDRFERDGDSDEASLAYLSEAFGELLAGAALIGNHSRWMNFRTVHCARWHHGNVVLLGDAAATADPSLGSGTKLALEAAIALAGALADADDDPPVSRLPAYERELRPSVERLQGLAGRSQLWWESFPSRLHLSPARIAAAYMSRAGAVSLAKLESASPALARRAVADFAGVGAEELPGDDLPGWILGRPLAVNGHTLPSRVLSDTDGDGVVRVPVDCADPWGEEAQRVIDRLEGVAERGPAVVALTGEGSRSGVLDRLALAERVRTELGVPVAVGSGQSHLDDAVDGLVAGRADLVAIEEEPASEEQPASGRPADERLLSDDGEEGG